MSVQIILHPVLRGMIDDGPIEVTGKTVGECLAALVQLYPVLEKVLFKEEGELKKWIEIYVNSKCTYPEDLDYPVRDCDELRVILLLFTGG